jgi:putative transcriptional regulator
VKTVRSNIKVLVAQKSQREKRRITLRTVIQETGINKHTIYAIANDTLREYPVDVMARLCEYFNCDLSDLLFLEEVEEAPIA